MHRRTDNIYSIFRDKVLLLGEHIFLGNPDHVNKHPNNDRGHGSHCQQCASARDRHSHQGSRWAESKATCRFCAQLAQFNTGTKSFQKRTCPLASQLISVIHNESRTTQIRNKQSKLAASAFQISQHKQAAQNQISQQIGDFLRTQAYEQAPQEKMTAFKSL
jgi:hypothetical protein